MPRSRRVKGTGTIYYNQSRDRWMAQTTITDPATGKPRKISRSAKTAKQAQALLNQLLTTDTDGTPTTTATTIHAWLDWYAGPYTQQRLAREEITEVSAQHIGVKIQRLKKVIPPKMQLADLDARAIDTIRTNIDHSPYAKATKARDIRELSTAIDVAVYKGLLETNRVALMRRPSEGARKPRTILTPAQARQLLEAVKDTPLEAWYLIAVPLGARCMEVCGLTWDRINMTTGTVTFTHQLTDRHGGLRLVPLKGRREGDQRSAPIAHWQIERLQHIHAHQQTQIESGAWPTNTLNLVCLTKTGKPVHNAMIAKDLKARTQQLGLPTITPHSFRRGAVSIMLSQGIDIATCMKIMGWRDPKVPLQIYAELTDDGFAAARNVVANLATG